MEMSSTANDVDIERLRRSIVEPPSMSTWSKLVQRKTRRTHTYHAMQDTHIRRLVQVAGDPTASRLGDAQENTDFHIKAAIYISIYGTILVAALQIYAAVTTLSLSLFVTMAESCCEAASNIGLNWIHKKAKKLNDSPRWPAGAARLGNAGNICFAFTLMAVSLVLIVESIRSFASSEHEPGKFSTPAIVAASAGFGIKLGLAVYCFIFRKHSSQVEMLWEDNRNDCFEYGLAIFTSAAGAKLSWWVDPAGAMLIAVAIIISWIGTVKSEFLELCGIGASPNLIQEIAFITIRHSPLILKVDTIHAYHWGEDLIVEVDIVMAPDQRLREVHDISQQLQDTLETVEGIGRAFVHVDHGKVSLRGVRTWLSNTAYRNVPCPRTSQNPLIARSASCWEAAQTKTAGRKQFQEQSSCLVNYYLAPIVKPSNMVNRQPRITPPLRRSRRKRLSDVRLLSAFHQDSMSALLCSPRAPSPKVAYKIRGLCGDGDPKLACLHGAAAHSQDYSTSLCPSGRPLGGSVI